MALNAAALDVGGEAIATALAWAQFHSAAPGSAGTSNVIAGGRVAINMDSTDGNLSLAAPVTKTGLTAGATVSHVSFWSASAGGNHYGDAPRTTGDAAVNSSGEYTLDSISIPVSSS